MVAGVLVCLQAQDGKSEQNKTRGYCKNSSGSD